MPKESDKEKKERERREKERREKERREKERREKEKQALKEKERREKEKQALKEKEKKEKKKVTPPREERKRARASTKTSETPQAIRPGAPRSGSEVLSPGDLTRRQQGEIRGGEAARVLTFDGNGGNGNGVNKPFGGELPHRPQSRGGPTPGHGGPYSGHGGAGDDGFRRPMVPLQRQESGASSTGGNAPPGLLRKASTSSFKGLKRTASMSSVQSTISSTGGIQKDPNYLHVIEVDKPNGGNKYLLNGDRQNRTPSTLPWDREQQERFIDLQLRRSGLNQETVKDNDSKNLSRVKEGKEKRKLTSSQTVLKTPGGRYYHGRSSQVPEKSEDHSEIKALNAAERGQPRPAKKKDKHTVEVEAMSQPYRPCTPCENEIVDRTHVKDGKSAIYVMSESHLDNNKGAHNDLMDDLARRYQQQHLDEDRAKILQQEHDEAKAMKKKGKGVQREGNQGGMGQRSPSTSSARQRHDNDAALAWAEQRREDQRGRRTDRQQSPDPRTLTPRSRQLYQQDPDLYHAVQEFADLSTSSDEYPSQARRPSHSPLSRSREGRQQSHSPDHFPSRAGGSRQPSHSPDTQRRIDANEAVARQIQEAWNAESSEDEFAAGPSDPQRRRR